MIKYLKCMSIIIIICLLQVIVFADSGGGYGRVISRNTFEGWAYYYDYSGNTFKTTQEAHSGYKSLEYDTSNNGGVNLQTNSVVVNGNNGIYMQFYVKGYTQKPTSLKFMCKFFDSAGSTIEIIYVTNIQEEHSCKE